MPNSTITMSTRIMRHPDLMAVPMDGDLVMMSISQGNYYGINPVGVTIWENLQTPQTIEQLCEAVMREFAVDADTCSKDVQTFITQMLDQKIVQTA